MQNFPAILQNQVLIVALIACFLAQGLKLLIEVVQHGKLNFKVLFEAGGMPSSHSAFVTALAVGVGQTMGWDSPELALALVFAIIVMYDAAGVRQAAGNHARILNQMVAELFRDHAHLGEIRLKELLGHTPAQVVAGSILGAAVSCLVEMV